MEKVVVLTFFILDLLIFSALISRRFWRSRKLLFLIFIGMTTILSSFWFFTLLPGANSENSFYFWGGSISFVGIFIFTYLWFSNRKSKIKIDKIIKKVSKLATIISFLLLFFMTMMLMCLEI